MITSVAQVALVVRDYDEAIAFYRERLGFDLIEDTLLGAKRWVRLRAPGERGCDHLLSKAVDGEQLSIVGRQAGGRVLFFLHTDDFDRDYALCSERGVEFLEPPRVEPYGKVAVLRDLYGNRIDLIEPSVSR